VARCRTNKGTSSANNGATVGYELEWEDWFNNRRLLEPIGNLLPVEFELAYHQQWDEQDIAA
jgi:transposase InsO family protein